MKDFDARDYALELIDEGTLNARDFAIMCVKWMSKYDVEDMLEANEIDPRSISEAARLDDFMMRNA